MQQFTYTVQRTSSTGKSRSVHQLLTFLLNSYRSLSPSFSYAPIIIQHRPDLNSMDLDGSNKTKAGYSPRPRGHSLQSFLRARPSHSLSEAESEPAGSENYTLTFNASVHPLGQQNHLFLYPVVTASCFKSEAALRSEPIDINSSRVFQKDLRLSYPIHCGFTEDIRDECYGKPPEISYLKGDENTPVRFRIPRRSTLADKPELDGILRATMTLFKDRLYLPITATTIHHLQPYVNGAKPVVKTSLFSCVLLNKELNAVHADHVVAVLRYIGQYVTHVLVVSPIHTSEMGDVFNREVGDMGSGNDWGHILSCFPHLQWLMLLLPDDTGTGLPSDTYTALREAVSRRQSKPEQLRYDSGPPKLLLV